VLRIRLFAIFWILLTPQTGRAQLAFDLSYWKILLHDQSRFFGGTISEIHNPDFFSSPQGATDPDAELKASLQAIAEKRLYQEQPFECVFPARYHYLKETYALQAIEAPCPALEKWKAQFAADSVTVIFATAYLGNVASAFGHAFLKINSKPGTGHRDELLDFGFSYAAKNSPNDNPLTFAWKGLTGGYMEDLSVMPYFTRLSEYHNIENRDVWEYRLKILPSQVDRLLDHVWELKNAQMDYYFLNRNCAYHLLALLQVANPAWRLTERFSYTTIPADGIKALTRVGAVSQVRFRPSIYHKLKQKILAMSDDEKAAFKKSLSSHLELSGHESGLVLESLLDYQQFSIQHSNREPGSADEEKQDELFLKLATAKTQTPQLPSINAESQPDLGHASSKVSVIFSAGTANTLAELELRPTFHDLLDHDEGYTQFSQFEAGTTRLGYSTLNHQASLQSFELINIISLTPVDSLLSASSWLLKAGALVPPDSACTDCISAQLQGGDGWSAYLMPKSENVVAFALLKFNLESGLGTPGAFRWGPSELLGVDLHLSRSIKFLTELEFTQYFNQHLSSNNGPYTEWTTGLSWYTMQNLELRFIGIYQQLPVHNASVANLALGYYF